VSDERRILEIVFVQKRFDIVGKRSIVVDFVVR
jgi:hypothetical protein